MPGPAPKNPATRQRRNKKPTASVMDGEFVPMRDLPEVRPDGLPWRPETLDMWRDVQASPMKDEYVAVDFHLGLAFAMAFDAVMGKPAKGTLDAMRPFIDHFGLSPRSRRSLQWEIKRAETPAVRPTPTKVRDPRLRAVS